jgi:phosphatidylserine synthase
MRSSIVFFDKYENGIIGTIRGVMLFPIFIIITVIYLYLTQKIYGFKFDWTFIIAIIIFGVLMVSAISVRNKPEKFKESMVWSMLIGFVVYGCISSVLLTQHKYIASILTVIYGILSSGLLGYIIYLLVDNFKELSYDST